MRRLVIVLFALAGCGQIAGITDLTSDEVPDAGNSTPPVEDAGTEVVTMDVVVVDSPVEVTETDKGFRRVFVTSGAYLVFPNSGVVTADNQCDKAATENGLKANGEKWIAWMSAETSRAVDRLPFPGEYRLIDADASVVVSQRKQLTENGLLHAIDVNERKEVVEGTDEQRRVWTGTQANGNIGEHCANWTNFGAFGTVGRAGLSGTGWTGVGNAPCGLSLRLYCFEL